MAKAQHGKRPVIKGIRRGNGFFHTRANNGLEQRGTLRIAAQAGHSRNKQQTNPQWVSFFMPEVLPVAKSCCFGAQKPPRQRAKPLSRGLIRVWISAKPEEAVQNSVREPKACRKQKSAAKPTVRRVIFCRLRPRVSEKTARPKHDRVPEPVRGKGTNGRKTESGQSL